MTCETPESEGAPSDDLKDEYDSNIRDTNDEDLDIDYESDLKLNHILVSRGIKSVYDNGWFTGTITWFNSKLQKVLVVFEDGTADYISNEDIDGVGISLVWSFIFQLS